MVCVFLDPIVEQGSSRVLPLDLTKDDIAAIDLAGSSLTIAERIRESGIQWTINASILFGIFYLVKIRSQNPVPF